ncbi:MAG: aminotransferase class IV [Micrococcaceae bacterium]
MSIAFLHEPYNDTDQISAFDLGVTHGDGVFETLLAVKNDHEVNILQLEDHLSRLQKSLTSLDLQLNGDIMVAAHSALSDEIVAHPEETEFVLRFFVTAGLEKDNRTQPLAWVTANPRPEASKAASQQGVNVQLLSKGHPADFASHSPWALQSTKSTSYATAMATLRFVQKNGFDEAIYTTAEGYILEGPTSNVVFRQGKTLYTPEPELGLLHGTTQRSIYRAAKADGYQLKYGQYKVEDLINADGAWLTSSVRLFTPILSIDKKPVANLDETHAFHDTMKRWILKN